MAIYAIREREVLSQGIRATSEDKVTGHGVRVELYKGVLQRAKSSGLPLSEIEEVAQYEIVSMRNERNRADAWSLSEALRITLRE